MADTGENRQISTRANANEAETIRASQSDHFGTVKVFGPINNLWLERAWKANYFMQEIWP
jgi:hypothetical protein